MAKLTTNQDDTLQTKIKQKRGKMIQSYHVYLKPNQPLQTKMRQNEQYFSCKKEALKPKWAK